MRWLIRKITRQARSGAAFDEDIHYGDVLTLGRGADQAIFLPDLRAALAHARVTALGPGQYRIESLITAGVRVNGSIVSSTTAGPGSQIDIGTTRVQLLEPPRDFEAAVEVSQIDKAEIDAQDRARAPTLTLTEAGLRKRAASWSLFILVLVLALGVPLAAHYVPSARPLTDNLPIASRMQWETGSLAASHHFFGKECTSCHLGGFVSVQDASCRSCHQNTPGHADPAKFDLALLGDGRCAFCHRDHNGVDALVRADQELCSDCHQNLSSRGDGIPAQLDVSDFGKDHPGFVVTLPAWNSSGAYAPVRAALSTPGIREGSGLKFPHDTHLAATGIRGPDGDETLVCASCHRPEAGGARLQPIQFESDCQRCHQLTFSVRGADRQVQHGKVAEIGFAVQEFFAREALEGGFDQVDAPTIVRARRRPGQSITPQERAEALTWARDQATTALDRLFDGRACSECHTSFRDEAGAWNVKPVRVAGSWFPRSDFSHRKHDTMNCASCHQAETSSDSSDLLLPDIDNCRECHGGEHARGKVPSTCISCHGFHTGDAR
jgi:pSer/pThr/pTyr-binding forkhead associated (FHA) protein